MFDMLDLMFDLLILIGLLMGVGVAALVFLWWALRGTGRMG